MSGLLGALAGAGEAYTSVADTRIQQINSRELEQMRQQAEMMKEQRAEESAKRLGLFKEGLEINSENRKLANDKISREQEFEFETNPENAKRAAQAKITEVGLLDEYKYGNVGKEAAYKRRLAEATRFESPDRTDYAKRALEREKLQAEIEKIKSEGGAAAQTLKGSKVVKVPFGDMGETRDVIMLANGEFIDPVELMKQKEQAALQEEQKAKLTEAELIKQQLFGEKESNTGMIEEVLKKQKGYEEKNVQHRKRTGAGATVMQPSGTVKAPEVKSRKRTGAGKTVKQ